MDYFIDSDAVKKMAQFTLLPELCQAYSVAPSQFFVLPELKYQLHLGNIPKATKKLGSAEAVGCLERFLTGAQEVCNISTDAANEILALDHPNLDVGERVLLAALVSTPDSKMLSGDKRAFVAISEVKSNHNATKLWHRFICFEEALFRIINTSDFSEISRKVRARSDVDSAIRMAFGVSEPSGKSVVIEALRSYIGHLGKQTNGKYIFSLNL